MKKGGGYGKFLCEERKRIQRGEGLCEEKRRIQSGSL